MKRIFVDTSGWLAILVASDINHSKAVSLYTRLIKEGVHLSTHEGVLLEVGNALSNARSRNIVVGLREKIVSSELITLTNISEDLSNEAWKLYAERERCVNCRSPF